MYNIQVVYGCDIVITSKTTCVPEAGKFIIQALQFVGGEVHFPIRFD
jgi:hypothetical protein